MRALFVFLKKMDFKDPRGINTRDRKNERTKPTQGVIFKSASCRVVRNGLRKTTRHTCRAKRRKNLKVIKL